MSIGSPRSAAGGIANTVQEQRAAALRATAEEALPADRGSNNSYMAL